MYSESSQDEKFPETAGIAKAATGINGLDEILMGGLPSGSLTLINGGPGTGKTILGSEFIYRGAINGEPGIILSFEEKAETLKNNALTLGWDFRKLENENKLSVIEARIDPQAVLSGRFDLSGLLAIIDSEAARINSKRILIDGPDVFLRLLDDLVKERNELYSFKNWLEDNQITTALTIKKYEGDYNRYEFLDYLCDCVIQLDQRVYNQIATRRLRVLKCRGSDFGRNEYPFAIYLNGVKIIPVTTTSLQHKGLGKSVSSGVEKLDELLGGGYRRNSCNLISGTSGTGKTTLVCSFVSSICQNGEKALYIDFEESQQAVVEGMLSPGINLKAHIDKGLLKFHPVMPEALGVEEHLVRVFRLIEEFNPGFLVVDAISACRRMGDKHAAFDYILRLINYCKQRGITTLLTNLADNEREGREITGIDLSSVIDTVILLRNVEFQGRLNRLLLILKSRARAHSNQCHLFKITDNGIKIGGVYSGAEKRDERR
ncbi:circadian clock protein KaiC [Sedimentisphaera salicampi]|uniref:non-specific serine/threonine protein kinase n=1 Tax=Sedimentisphaera salicampi TaxID=1941349 RepID=A0A1W6LJH5_9BACT|nr:circadian clock protein KaiC [Sedimentisphaera salicampi]ARN55893.1 Circadian clock protein kinase KaiC [Sedimentisphaera salicampi]